MMLIKPITPSQEFDVPAGYKLLCGMSMGYPKEGSLINSYNPGRAEVQTQGLD